MAKQQTGTWLPTSGEIIGMVVKAFGLDDVEVGGPSARELNATTQKTAQRYFRGERKLDHETIQGLRRSFAKALMHSGLLGTFSGTVRVGDGTATWDELLADAIEIQAVIWDAEVWPVSVTFPNPDRRIATLVVARQVVIEMALRYAALVRIGNWKQPDAIAPHWATSGGLGSLLKGLRDACPSAPTEDEIAKATLVTKRSVYRWFEGSELPTLVNIDALAGLLAERTKGIAAQDNLTTLRRARGVASLAQDFAALVGSKEVESLGAALYRFVKRTLEITAGESPQDENVLAECAKTILAGTAQPWNEPFLKAWYACEKEIPWPDDIMHSHPTRRGEHLKQCIRLVGDAELRQSELREIMPNAPEEVRRVISDVAARIGMSSRSSVTPEMLTKLRSVEVKELGVMGKDALMAGLEMDEARKAAARHDYPTACIHASRGVRLQRQRADYRFYFGAYLWQVNRASEALEQLRTSCKLKPEWDRPFVEIAVVYVNTRHRDQAIRHLENGPKSMRESSAYYQFTLGRLYHTEERYSEALPYLEAAINLDANHGDAYDLASECAFMGGDRRKGERYAKEAHHRGASISFQRWQSGFYK